VARIRSIKPEIRRSLTVCSWKYPVRWTFAGLPGYCDDEGRALDDVRLIKAELYPLDDDMTSRKLEHHLTTIAANGPLCRYEVEGKRYLHLTSFGEHQRVNRPTPSRLPPCPIHEQGVSTHGTVTEPSPPRAQARVPAEQGREGNREKEGSSEQGTRAPRDPAGGHPAQALLDEHQALTARPLANGSAAALLGHISEALDRATPDQVRTALAEHRRRPGSKPGLLPHLLDDVLAHATAAALADDPTQDPELQQWLANEQAKAAAR
jgi:hypothetical protein